MSSIRICLDKALTQRGITRYELNKRIGSQYQTVDNYYKNKVSRYDRDILLRICIALDCGIDEIIEVVR